MRLNESALKTIWKILVLPLPFIGYSIPNNRHTSMWDNKDEFVGEDVNLSTNQPVQNFPVWRLFPNSKRRLQHAAALTDLLNLL